MHKTKHFSTNKNNQYMADSAAIQERNKIIWWFINTSMRQAWTGTSNCPVGLRFHWPSTIHLPYTRRKTVFRLKPHFTATRFLRVGFSDVFFSCKASHFHPISILSWFFRFGSEERFSWHTGQIIFKFGFCEPKKNLGAKYLLLLGGYSKPKNQVTSYQSSVQVIRE